jgi:hypothetical protein
MKKTVFKGIVNGINFDNVKEYNEYLTKLLNAGEQVEASTSTQTYDFEDTNDASNCVASNCVASNCVEASYACPTSYDEDKLMPYFGENDEYYLDALVSDQNSVNDVNLNKLVSVLIERYEYIKKYLSDTNISVADKKTYIENISDILKCIKEDTELNKEAIEKSSATRLKARVEYDKVIAAAEHNYNTTIEKCESEERVLNGARIVIDKLKGFYTDVLNCASRAVEQYTNSECDCQDKCNKCKCDKCKCESSTDNNVKTEIKEINSQKVTDINTLFNRIFGFDIKNISHLLNE